MFSIATQDFSECPVSLEIQAEGKQWIFDPQLDIASYEVAMLLKWFVCHLSYRPNTTPNVTFLRENHLMRHFKEA